MNSDACHEFLLEEPQMVLAVEPRSGGDAMTPERMGAIQARLKATAGLQITAHMSGSRGVAMCDWLRHTPADLRDLLAEVERLRALVDGDAYRAGQEAMLDRARAVCRQRAERHQREVDRAEWQGTDSRVDGARMAEAEACADAILALEVG
jgi:NAD(P)H-flavin reductase